MRRFESQRVGGRVEVALEGSPFLGRPDAWVAAYDDPDEAIVDAEAFLEAAREAKAHVEAGPDGGS